MAIAAERTIHDVINVVASSPTGTLIKSYEFNEDTAIRFELKLVAKEIDGTSRACFKRTALLYRLVGGDLLIENGYWNTDQSLKSHSSMEVSYTLLNGFINIFVHCADTGATKWYGTLNLMVA